ncbi:hypothetical protein Ancab_025185, partial [Ancistrocladus abbreviatus]
MAWIKCQGILLQAWTEDVFKRIASWSGMVIRQDRSLSNRDRFNITEWPGSNVREFCCKHGLKMSSRGLLL